MRWLADPRAFNVAIIVMFLAAAVRWAAARNWPQASYWLAAAVLNVAVTFMAVK
jgi:hypothetical protein